MQVAQHIFVLAHLVGFAALFGGILVQTRSPEPEVSTTMLWGGWTELVTGLVLVALAWLGPGVVSWGAVGTKLAVTLFLVLLLTRNRRYLSVPRGLWAILGALTLLNAALAVLWP